MQLFTLVKIIDLLSFIILTMMISTGAVLEFTLPVRSGPLSVWGMTRHEWGSVHSVVSIIFLVLMSSHLILHFTFIKSAIAGNATREQMYRLAIGLIALIALIALAISPVVSPVNLPQDGQFGRHLNHN
jgi:hypothetical protein